MTARVSIQTGDFDVAAEIAALRALADEGTVERSVVGQAIEKYGVDPETAPPWTV